MFIPSLSSDSLTVLIGSLRGIMNDPVMFPEPDKFNPERFINAKDPRMQNFELPFGTFPQTFVLS